MMITASRQAGTRRRKVALRTLIALAILLPASACSSATTTAASSTGATAASGATPSATCNQVAAILTDGPDPGADPVGYAEAQILPLRQIQTSDATLAKAITGLAEAYSSYSADNGTNKTNKTVTATLTTAINRINSLCPGAGATP